MMNQGHLAWLLILGPISCSRTTPVEAGTGEPDVVAPYDQPGDAGLAMRVDCAAVKGGPPMIEVGVTNGANYCIDATEVTQKQYAEFLASQTQAPGTEHPSCEWNKTYVPFHSDDDEAPGICACPHGVADCWYSPEKMPNRPVVCVDWCDAVAFCAWAGKKLCGKVGGGELDFESRDEASTSEWFNACSNGGTTTYPYGNAFMSDACHIGTEQSSVAGDVKSSPQCHGTSLPYSAIHDMSGGVFEWEDSCGTANGVSSCAAPGGGNDESSTRCDFGASFPPVSTQFFIGFRCCK